MADGSICSIENCCKTARCRGWCPAHYERWRIFGDPRHGGDIGTSPGVPAKFLAEEVIPHRGRECLPWPYARDSNGYGQVRLDGKAHYVTRLICEAVYGPPPSPKHQAAHNCGKGHEGRCNPEHLRWATVQENHLDKKKHGTFVPPPNRWKRKAAA